ncbi:MAG: adenine deaminase [Nitrospirae bacterium GWC2_57_9]|nr:MAG: adenine deaminase [Nitrospirae bacterium GWC2_57_9]
MKSDLAYRIEVARGLKKADLVLRGGSILNVFSGEVYRADVAIAGGRIAGLGEYRGKKSIDVSSRLILPGLIDSHVHLESSMLMPAEFARAALPHGVTTVVADPHEIANVLGKKGIELMLDATEGLPLDFFFMLPSCVPSSPFETSGAGLTALDLAPFLKHRRVLGLAEMMDYPGVLSGRRDVLRKLEAVAGRPIDGHAPALGGKDLNAYAGTGISSEHECASAAEASEKVRAGMTIFIREGSAARNLTAILPAVTPANSRFFCFATDDLQPVDLRAGSIDRLVKKAIRLGLDAVSAVQMATINPARHFGLSGTGAIAPGYRADMIVIDDLKNFTIEKVFKNGVLAASKGRMTAPLRAHPSRFGRNTVKTGQVGLKDLRLSRRTGRARVIELIPDEIETRQRIMPVIVDSSGQVANERDRGIAKLVVVERHRASGRIGLGLVKGFGFRSGAIGATVAHDAHNIIVAGMHDEDILAAIQALRRMRGGLVVVKEERILAALPLPIAGLLSDKPVRIVAKQQAGLARAAARLGIKLSSPFATLSFLALPVVPELKLTDRGLVDVQNGKVVELFV